LGLARELTILRYTEATPNLYAQNTFSFTSTGPLLNLTSSIRLNRFNSVTSLAFVWTIPTLENPGPPLMFMQRFIPPNEQNAKWRVALCHQTCIVVQSMKGLQRLQVHMWPYRPIRAAMREELRDILGCLRLIKRPSDYSVIVGYPEPTTGSEDYEALGLGADFEGSPYTLRWIG
jgi:hypothetical protein